MEPTTGAGRDIREIGMQMYVGRPDRKLNAVQSARGTGFAVAAGGELLGMFGCRLEVGWAFYRRHGIENGTSRCQRWTRAAGWLAPVDGVEETIRSIYNTAGYWGSCSFPSGWGISFRNG